MVKGSGGAARIPGFSHKFLLALLGMPFGVVLHHFTYLTDEMIEIKDKYLF